MKRKWQRHDRVINPLGEIRTVVKRINKRSVQVEYDGTRRKSGIAYDTALIQPWPENDPRRGRGYFERLEQVQPRGDSGKP